jgi:hypothetical protein
MYKVREEPGYRSWYSDWLRSERLRGRNLSPGKDKNFVFSTLWAHPASYPMGTGGSFLWGKAAKRELFTYLQLVSRSRKHGSIHPLPHTSSWRSTLLVKHRDNFTLLLTKCGTTPFGRGVVSEMGAEYFEKVIN